MQRARHGDEVHNCERLHDDRAEFTTDDGIEVTPDPNRQYDYKVYVGGMYQYWSCTRDVLQPKPDISEATPEVDG